jgi:ferritin-like metal-binding protein YciE
MVSINVGSHDRSNLMGYMDIEPGISKYQVSSDINRFVEERMDENRHLIDWLRDAHGMEQQAQEVLKRQASRLKNYPDLQQRVERHVHETERQAERIEKCLERYGESVSVLKDAMGKVSGNFGAIMNAAAEDEVLKNVIADYAFEHFEIASYRSLIGAAEILGDMETADVCRQNLQEEEAMAKWVEEHIDSLTKAFLEREAADVTAKR